MRKSNTCSVHKKENKQVIVNYRPVSLPLICGKKIERLTFISLFEYFEKNKLL